MTALRNNSQGGVWRCSATPPDSQLPAPCYSLGAGSDCLVYTATRNHSIEKNPPRPATATLGWFETRGFGFIEADDDGTDIFVHIATFDQAGLDDPGRRDGLVFTRKTRTPGRFAVMNLWPA